MRYQDLLSKLTLEEKIALCEGQDFWHTRAAGDLPAAMLSDGPHGLRKQQDAGDMLGMNRSIPATCFPTAAATANSWDPELLGQIGQAIGEEALAEGVGVVLGPGVNLKRNPLCGRNFEYFSEDPLLAGTLGAAFVKGQQSTGASSCVKHFALNQQEYKRFSSDSIVDERTLRELYLPAFERVVREAKPGTVMCAYNKLNGVHCSENKELLTDILRDEWGFDGAVMTDWGAMNDRVGGFAAGCDLMMPGGSGYMADAVAEAVRSGALPEEAVDRCADRVLCMMERAARAVKGSKAADLDAHHALACRAATRSAVLLKNESVLPIQEGTTVALLGGMAEQLRYQGAGSSHIVPTRLPQPIEQFPSAIYAAGYDANGDATPESIAEAVRVASSAEVAIVFAGLPDRCESEGFDRETLALPQGHNALIEAVAAANPRTVVVLLGGGVMELPWLDKVGAVLYMALPGQGGAEAAAALLYGRAVPAGKLSETWPMRLADVPSAAYYAGTRKDAQYREGIYVGYRYYDKAGVPVRFPFGYGLSYTQFAYLNLEVTKTAARVTVQNVGDCAGEEIVQLYVAPPAGGLHRPAKELRGFARVQLAAGETKCVEIPLNDRSFAVWDQGWVVPGGTYTIMAGGSSADLPLCAELTLDGPEIAAPEWQAGSWYEAPKGTPPQEDWQAMLGREVAEPVVGPGSFTWDNTLLEMAEFSPTVRGMVEGMRQQMMQQMGLTDENDPTLRMLLTTSADCALRAMFINASGTVGWNDLLGLLGAANAGM